MDKDLDRRLQNIEQRLAHRNDFDSAPIKSDDEIELRELWNVIWAGKFKIIAITMLFSVASIFYALSLPNMYKSYVVLAPSQSDSNGGLSSLVSQYGGLAAMAGINLGGSESGRIEQAIELLKSWSFLDTFVKKYKLKSKIMAIEKWDKNSNELIYDVKNYDQSTSTWISELKGGSGEPSSYEVYRKLSSMLSVTSDTKTGMLTVAVEYFSPEIAFEWVILLKKEINLHFQRKDMLEAIKNIEYLNNKIQETNISEMRDVFYSMIENQTKTLMLAEVSDEYLVNTVVPPMISELKSKPKRAVICVLGTLFGGMISVLIVIVRYLYRTKLN